MSRYLNRKNPIFILCSIVLLLALLLGCTVLLYRIDKEAPKVESKHQEKVQILLDAQYDAHAEYQGSSEKEICLTLIKEIKENLSNRNIHTEIINQKGTTFQDTLSMQERIAYSKKINPGFIFSIRTPIFNEQSGVKLYGHIKSKDIFTLANAMQSAMQQLGWQCRGIYDADIYKEELISDKSQKGLVLEAGILYNDKDRELLTNTDSRKKFVNEIANLLEQYSKEQISS